MQTAHPMDEGRLETRSDLDYIQATLGRFGMKTDRETCRKLWSAFSIERNCAWKRVDNYGPEEILAVAESYPGCRTN